MPAQVVADSTPIIHLARVNQLGLLRACIPALIVPDEVYREVAEKGAGQPGATEVTAGDWITRQTVTDLKTFHGIPADLHAGEREAIALARQLQLPLLIDERAGRAAAKALGLATVTTLAVLLDAKQAGHIPLVQPIVDQLRATRFYLRTSEYEAFLNSAGERP